MKRLIVMLGALAVSCSSTFVRFSAAPSMTLVFYRMAIISLCMLGPVLLRCRDEFAKLTRKNLLLCAVSGASLGLHFSSYFESLHNTSICTATLLTNTEIIFVALAGIVVLKERITKMGWVGIAFALGGSILITLSGGTDGGSAFYGMMLATLSAVLISVYTLIGRVMRRTYTATFYSFLVYVTAGVTVLLVGSVSGQNVLAIDGRSLLMSACLAVVCTLCGHSVYSWGLKYEPAAFISAIKLLEPVFAAVLGVIIFREIPGAGTVIGGVIVIVGIWWYSRHSEEPERSVKDEDQKDVIRDGAETVAPACHTGNSGR